VDVYNRHIISALEQGNWEEVFKGMKNVSIALAGTIDAVINTCNRVTLLNAKATEMQKVLEDNWKMDSISGGLKLGLGAAGVSSFLARKGKLKDFPVSTLRQLIEGTAEVSSATISLLSWNMLKSVTDISVQYIQLLQQRVQATLEKYQKLLAGKITVMEGLAQEDVERLNKMLQPTVEDVVRNICNAMDAPELFGDCMSQLGKGGYKGGQSGTVLRRIKPEQWERLQMPMAISNELEDQLKPDKKLSEYMQGNKELWLTEFRAEGQKLDALITELRTFKTKVKSGEWKQSVLKNTIAEIRDSVSTSVKMGYELGKVVAQAAKKKKTEEGNK